MTGSEGSIERHKIEGTHGRLSPYKILERGTGESSNFARLGLAAIYSTNGRVSDSGLRYSLQSDPMEMYYRGIHHVPCEAIQSGQG